MRIVVAKTAGFCMGVKRAVELGLDTGNKPSESIYTFGPLIHNPQVLNLLKEKGITILDTIPDKAGGIVLIRAHGVPPQVQRELKQVGFEVVDATCPRVIKVQTIICKHARKDYATIIIGDADHPEVVGLLGYTAGRGYVAADMESVRALPAFDRAIIVAQTTQNMQLFTQVKEWAGQHHPHYLVFNTICDSTEKRQSEVTRLARAVDAMVVVGGHNSGNTQRLADIARKTGKPVYQVETAAELDEAQLAGFQKVGITAGASTPNWITNDVCRVLEELPYKKGRGVRCVLFRLQRVLLLTSLYVSVGACALSYAGMHLQNIRPSLAHAMIALLYVLSMHILNHLTGGKADRYNDPKRASFYTKYRYLLAFLATAAGAAGLVMAYSHGWLPFSILLIMSVMGLTYNRRLLPRRLFNGKGRLKDIPGSKTVLIALAWGVVTSLLPYISEHGRVSLQGLVIFFGATAMVFARTAFFDILDMQGDRIVGRGTIPLVFGARKTFKTIQYTLLILAGVLLATSLVRFISSLGALLALCPLIMYLVMDRHRKGLLLPGIRLEFLIDTHFILAGGLAWVWAVV